MSWQPLPDALSKVVHLFVSARHVDNATHQQVVQQLRALEKHPEFMAYLAYILNHMRDQREELRQRVGIYLKNCIAEYWPTTSEPVREYVKHNVLLTMDDQSKFVRSTVGTIVVTICDKEGLRSWPGMLEHLVQLLDHGNLAVVDAAFNALNKLCEDLTAELDSAELGRPLNVMIPKFISLFQHQTLEIRRYAINAVNQFLHLMPQALAANMNNYMQGLFMLTRDENPQVRKRVCQAFVLLLDSRLQFVQPQLVNVVKFMMVATSDSNAEVALEACEFWLAYCEEEQADRQLLHSVLPHLVPVLLNAMRYSDIDVAVLGGDEDANAGVADGPEDIRPRFHTAQTANGPDATPPEDDEDWPDEDEILGWTLRKCAASSFDSLGVLFKGELLPVFLPLLAKGLRDPDWRTREAGILALGALANGCTEALTQWLPELMNCVLQSLSDAKPLVRSVSCWTLSRYIDFLLSDSRDEIIFRPMMEELLKCVRDRHKRVQEAACSAFSTLLSKARVRVVPYLRPILTNLVTAFSLYQKRNRSVLLDTIAVLADSVKQNLNRPEYAPVLLPPLFELWNTTPDDDEALFPLLECLTSVVQAVGPGFAQFAPQVFGRSMQLVENTLTALQRHRQAMAIQQASEHDAPNHDFIVVGLDLLSGLAEGITEQIEPLVANSNLLPVLHTCAQDREEALRQSAFALLGDLARWAMGQLHPHLNKFLPLAINNMNPTHIAVANNAIWAIGEIAMKVTAEMKPLVSGLMQLLVQIMANPEHPSSLLENTAITIGRLSYVAPDVIAPFLHQFSQQWCHHMASIRHSVEKEHAFRGLCTLVEQNPPGIVPAFPQFCRAIASWNKLTPEVQQLFGKLLHNLKTFTQAEWPRIWASVDLPVRNQLSSVYNL